LADAGFDVWLANTRGNKYSKNIPDIQTVPKEERLKFWQFTFDHMAKYDVPAVVDYILNKTNESSLVYIGYSQGTSKVFAALSLSEDLNRKISQVIALAPALRPKRKS
jgi:lysosomal acid lipase/cholesteryl ester hydrolase